MKLEVTNGLKKLQSHCKGAHIDEANLLFSLPSKKTLLLSPSEKADVQLTDARLPPNMTLTFLVKDKKTYLKINVLPIDIIRPYPESLSLNPNENYELRKGDIVEIFHQAYILRILQL